jgi:hypothetical protein
VVVVCAGQVNSRPPKTLNFEHWRASSATRLKNSRPSLEIERLAALLRRPPSRSQNAAAPANGMVRRLVVTPVPPKEDGVPAGKLRPQKQRRWPASKGRQRGDADPLAELLIARGVAESKRGAAETMPGLAEIMKQILSLDLRTQNTRQNHPMFGVGRRCSLYGRTWQAASSEPATHPSDSSTPGQSTPEHTAYAASRMSSRLLQREFPRTNSMRPGRSRQLWIRPSSLHRMCSVPIG